MHYNTIVKLVILACIIVVPFINYSRLHFFDNVVTKLVMLAIIAATSFYNMEIAILLTILFFLLIISSNNVVLKSATASKDKEKETFVMTDFPATTCPSQSQEPLNPYTYFIDDKIKPYEEYVKKLGMPDDAE